MRTSRLHRPSYLQLEGLVSFLEGSPGLGTGHLRTTQAKWETKRKWEEVATNLNALGGVVKDAKGWSKYWADKKYSLKRHVSQLNSSNQRTGGGTDSIPELSEIELRMVALLGGRGFAEGDQQFSVPLNLVPEEPDNNDNQTETIEEMVVVYQQLEDSPTASISSVPRERSPLRQEATQQSQRRRPRSQLDVERDRMLIVEEKRVDTEQIHAQSLREIGRACQQMSQGLNGLADAIRSAGRDIADAISSLALSPTHLH